MSATYTATDIAALTGVSEWSIYQSVRRGDCPFPTLRLGRRIVFPKAPVNRLLGISDPEEAA